MYKRIILRFIDNSGLLLNEGISKCYKKVEASDYQSLMCLYDMQSSEAKLPIKMICNLVSK